MNKQKLLDKKRQSKQRQQQNVDDDQIEKTLIFFDSILNPYLTDQDKIDENKSTNHTNTSSTSSSSSRYIRAPQLRHFSEQIPNVRRYTSEKNLNKIPPSPLPSKPKDSHSRLLRTTATSTEDLSKIPSDFIKTADQLDGSASLIDLSSIDKSSLRPRFRFVPSSNENHIFKEEQQFHIKTIPSNQTLFNNQPKPSHKIVKPIVIIPSVPKSAPISRLTETNIYHQNENSAFKPHRSSKTEQIKRTESNAHIEMTNLLPRHQQYHQSMLNLSSPELINTNQSGSWTSYQSNGYHSSRPVIAKDPISKLIQQVNHTSSLNGLVYTGNNRSQQQTYPYGSQISTSTGISPTVNNYCPQSYFKPINIHKNHSSHHSIPVQSVYFASPPVLRHNLLPSSFNVYNFNQNNSSRERQSKRNSRRQNVRITTYL